MQTKVQVDHTEECILLAAVECYPIHAPVERVLARGQELTGLSADEFQAEKNRIIARKRAMLCPN
jgi:hypothetical protein